MKFLPLLWSSLWRKKIRTIFTLLSVFVAFLLFGLLMTIRGAFSFGRRHRRHRSPRADPQGQPDHAAAGRLQGTAGFDTGRRARLAQTWFGGVYQDPANFFAQMVVEPEPFMKIYPEFKIPPDQVKAWLGDRQGAVVGVDLAKRFGWKVGDRVPITGTIWQPKQGQTWEFNIVGLYDGDQGVDKTQFFFRYDYLDENRRADRAWSAGTSSRSPMRRRRSRWARSSTACSRIRRGDQDHDRKGFVEGFAKQVGDIGAIMVAILVAVLFTMLLVAANTMAQSVRERTSEMGVLKTLGFSNGSILALILGESVLIAVIGGSLGLGLAWLIVQNGDPTNGMLPIFILPRATSRLARVMIVVLGLIAGALPAFNAMNLKNHRALREAKGRS
jgi:putative ABC transport system permease protein